MSVDWDKLDNKKKLGVDANFVSCSEDYEKNYLIDELVDCGASRDEAKKAVEHCCKTVSGNKPRNEFVKCLKGQLK
ncbi:MAG: hypothetical protein COW00_20050 [Bdellovibrio sp. CG12_big_fil_rev_8_21_14_0_65_39_13]|nr:MAG: hypothetical protein COW78_02815 [Bdellovibrio sp. CG22_combo_CG10-13_8_21_14_all_39_27]PIQ57522.1 MAG: hypothetical protein COW00_20050 [Bdellovibrio sp. CG12_big_fil_rev_8_21_14_0_65_39_13]PIR33724.1 MAG: hypothetical protein COV37_15135 [Bdellovibrio sp. CG11_big_fil_rev_8_21_14_0_20_39_38]PJB53086.1 MAG: hypothetical protein CO099_09050 [Bdellovibrio sp. CG_4_9_14_3_um_filter_39_7]